MICHLCKKVNIVTEFLSILLNSHCVGGDTRSSGVDVCVSIAATGQVLQLHTLIMSLNMKKVFVTYVGIAKISYYCI